MARKTQEKKAISPYIPFLTLKNLVGTLKSTTVPPVIDSSVLRSMSGSMRSQVMSALRFLDLIDANNTVQDKLKNLVKAYETDDWPQAVARVIETAYQGIAKDVDLKNGTSSQLNDAFRKTGNVEGQMLEKAVRFYLTALKEAETSFSPLFVMRGARTGLRPRTVPKTKKGRVRGSETAEDDVLEDDELSDGEIARFRFHVPNKRDAVIALPADIDADDWEMVKIMLDAAVKRLTKNNNGGVA